MKNLIAATSVLLLALLAGCTSGETVPRGNDGFYLSVPAHPAARADSQTSAQ